MRTFRNMFNPLLSKGIQKILNIVNTSTQAGQVLKSTADGSIEFVTSSVVNSNYKGEINVNTDFPLVLDVEPGWWYTISTDVTDNAGVTYTNTGLSFLVGETIYWDGETWNYYSRDTLTKDTVWVGDDSNLAIEVPLIDISTLPNTDVSGVVQGAQGDFIETNIGLNFGGTAASNIKSTSTTQVSETTKAYTGQTADYKQYKDANDNDIYRLDINGNIITTKNLLYHQSLLDSNELEGAGSYIDLASGKSGRGSIVFGDGIGYADFIFTSAGAVTLLMNSNNVFTTLQTGAGHVIIKDNGTNVRITNEMGSTIGFNIRIQYTN